MEGGRGIALRHRMGALKPQQFIYNMKRILLRGPVPSTPLEISPLRSLQ